MDECESEAATATLPVADENDQRALIDFLRERDVACPLCWYNLRGLTSARCPECGRELRLSVGLLEPRQGAWLTGQIALSASAGIGVLIALVCVVQGWPTGGPRQTLMNAMFLAHMATAPAAVVLLVCRRRYLRLPRGLQWLGAGLAVAGSCAGIVLLAIATE